MTIAGPLFLTVIAFGAAAPVAGPCQSASSAHVGDLSASKPDDQSTISSRFKRDLVELFWESRDEIVLELGTAAGKTTRVLARLFATVVSADASTQMLDENARRNADLNNIVHLQFHSVLDDWSVLARTRFSVVVIDAAHDYDSVKSDVLHAIALPGVHTLVLDDYGGFQGVYNAVNDLVAAGMVRIRNFIGEAPPWSNGVATVNDWEGVVLDPAWRCEGNSSSTTARPRVEPWSIVNTSWLMFPPGFLAEDGFLVPDGKLTFGSHGTGTSSDGSRFAWRQTQDAVVQPGEIYASSGEAYDIRLQGGDASMQLNGQHTSGMMLNVDGSTQFMLPSRMIRQLKEKLMFFSDA